MNRNTIIAIIAALVVVVGAIYLVMNRPAGEGVVNNPTGNSAEQGTGTFASLMGMAGAQECTISTQVEDTSSQGVVYVSGGKIRGDFTSTVNNQTMHSHMIHLGSTVYTWTDEMPQGFKMEVPQGDATSDTTSKEVFDANQNVQYSCKPWLEDSGKFTPPADIQFMDMNTSGSVPGGGSMPQGMPDLPADMPEIPEQYRTQ